MAIVLAETVQLFALDPRVVVLPLVLGFGLYLVLTAQPVGRPNLDLGERLRRLDVDERMRMAELGRHAGPPLFASQLLEHMLRPIVEDVGRGLAWRGDASWSGACMSFDRVWKSSSSWGRRWPRG
jgi:hypothetical protein